MHRFFVLDDNIRENTIIIDNKDDVKHISKVLRLREGESLILCNMKGLEYRCIIKEINKSFIEVKIDDINKSFQEDKLKIDLYQGLPKSNKLEYIIQKTIEVGVDSITPMITHRTIGNERIKKENKLDRYRKIAEAAAKQSHRGHIPEIREAVLFNDILEELKAYDLVIFAYESEEDHSLKDLIETLDIKEIEKVAIIIGAEGGFSKEEVELLKEKGILPVTLGKSILRTETAAIVCISMLNYVFNL